MKFSIRLIQLVALAAAAGWAGPPAAGWIDREIAGRKARGAWEKMQRGDAGAFDRQQVIPEYWLKIHSVGIDTLVIATESEAQLERHVGCVRRGGFTVISGHRDLHFRPLKDLREGAAFQLESLDGSLRNYRISRIEIIELDELPSRIDDGAEVGHIALVSCYPFYYVGKAPQRFVAWASPQS